MINVIALSVDIAGSWVLSLLPFFQGMGAWSFGVTFLGVAYAQNYAFRRFIFMVKSGNFLMVSWVPMARVLVVILWLDWDIKKLFSVSATLGF